MLKILNKCKFPILLILIMSILCFVLLFLNRFYLSIHQYLYHITQQIPAIAFVEEEQFEKETEHTNSEEHQEDESFLSFFAENNNIIQFDKSYNTIMFTPSLMSEQRQDKGYVFALKGTDLTTPIEISESILTLTEGRTFTREEIDTGKATIIIPKKILQKNNLKIGDSIAIELYDFEKGKNFLKSFTFLIVGAFQMQSIDSNYQNKEQMKLANSTFILPNKTLLEISKIEFNEVPSCQYIYHSKNFNRLNKFVNNITDYLYQNQFVSTSSEIAEKRTKKIKILEQNLLKIYYLVQTILTIFFLLFIYKFLKYINQKLIRCYILGINKRKLLFDMCLLIWILLNGIFLIAYLCNLYLDSPLRNLTEYLIQFTPYSTTNVFGISYIYLYNFPSQQSLFDLWHLIPVQINCTLLVTYFTIFTITLSYGLLILHLNYKNYLKQRMRGDKACVEI